MEEVRRWCGGVSDITQASSGAFAYDDILQSLEPKLEPVYVEIEEVVHWEKTNPWSIDYKIKNIL